VAIGVLNYSRSQRAFCHNDALINKVLNPPKPTLRLWVSDLVALFMPRRCAACDMGLMRFEESLCMMCMRDLPRARFHDDPSNRVEQLFWGKLQLEAASAFLLFSRSGKVQRMLHRLKYGNDHTVGHVLGRLMAEELMASDRFRTVDTLMPVPLHPRKERMRGFNQSQVLVDGMRQVWPLPCATKELMRVVKTPSQTRRGRLDRWTNVKEAFQLADPEALRDRHVLLVDDVVTTGATLEGCAKALDEVPGLRISICTVACA
jgi:ComF family protein